MARRAPKSASMPRSARSRSIFRLTGLNSSNPRVTVMNRNPSALPTITPVTPAGQVHDPVVNVRDASKDQDEDQVRSKSESVSADIKMEDLKTGDAQQQGIAQQKKEKKDTKVYTFVFKTPNGDKKIIRVWRSPAVVPTIRTLRNSPTRIPTMQSNSSRRSSGHFDNVQRQVKALIPDDPDTSDGEGMDRDDDDSRPGIYTLRPKYKKFIVGKEKRHRLTLKEYNKMTGEYTKDIVYTHQANLDFDSKDHIQALNSWSRQNYRRIGKQVQPGYEEGKRRKWPEDERDFLRQYMEKEADDRGQEAVKKHPNWTKVHQAFEAKFTIGLGRPTRKAAAISSMAERDPVIRKVRGMPERTAYHDETIDFGSPEGGKDFDDFEGLDPNSILLEAEQRDYARAEASKKKGKGKAVLSDKGSVDIYDGDEDLASSDDWSKATPEPALKKRKVTKNITERIQSLEEYKAPAIPQPAAELPKESSEPKFVPRIVKPTAKPASSGQLAPHLVADKNQPYTPVQMRYLSRDRQREIFADYPQLLPEEWRENPEQYAPSEPVQVTNFVDPESKSRGKKRGRKEMEDDDYVPKGKTNKTKVKPTSLAMSAVYSDEDDMVIDSDDTGDEHLGPSEKENFDPDDLPTPPSKGRKHSRDDDDEKDYIPHPSKGKRARRI